MSLSFTPNGSPIDRSLTPEEDRVKMAALPPFLRVLLTTDGTVTRSLESYFWEPVTVHCNYQQRRRHDQAIAGLDATEGQELIERAVILVGARSRRCYAYALSHINPAAVPAELCRKLEEQQLGIGELIREGGLETCREVLSIDRGVDKKFGEILQRRYRIVIDGRAAIHIRESFPLREYIAEHDAC